ncbi:MAG: type VI secretion system contractile sheath protein TssC, partial [Bacteroidota bacterium]
MAKTDKSQQPKTNQVQTGGKDLAQSAEQLARFGGFDILETTVEGIQNINPSRRARKEIFLTEKQNEGDKALLKRRMQLWLELLSSTEEVTDMVVQSQEKAQQAEETLNQNLVKAVDATRDLEQAYRTMAMFYKNTESDKVKNVSIVNAEMDQLTDLDVTTYFDAISEEIVQNYDRLDLRDNYSLMVIPGYMGSQKVIDKWAKMAHKNKVTLVTDFRHLDTPDDVMELFSNANHTGGDA